MLIACVGSAGRAAVIQSATYSKSGGSPCGIEFRTDGYVWVNESIYTQRYRWLTGSGVPGDYEIRSLNYTGTPGTFSTEPASSGVWVSLSSTQSWTRAAINQDRFVTADFQIRDPVSGLLLATASITIDCDMTPVGP